MDEKPKPIDVATRIAKEGGFYKDDDEEGTAFIFVYPRRSLAQRITQVFTVPYYRWKYRHAAKEAEEEAARLYEELCERDRSQQ